MYVYVPEAILCTIYGAVDFLIVPSKGLYGWGGGGGAGQLSSFMHLSGPSRAIAPASPPPIVWALKPPSWALHLLGLSLANICVCIRIGMLVCTHHILCWYANVGLSRVGFEHKTTYAPMIYGAPWVIHLMRAASITWASGRG
jgi:hypothetical protein